MVKSEGNWIDSIQDPNPDWKSYPSPVVEVTVSQTNPVDSPKPTKFLMRVSPKHKVAGSQELTVNLDKESKTGGWAQFAEVSVDSLENGGWTSEDGLLYYAVAFVGMSNQKEFKNKKWSFD